MAPHIVDTNYYVSINMQDTILPNLFYTMLEEMRDAA